VMGLVVIFYLSSGKEANETGFMVLQYFTKLSNAFNYCRNCHTTWRNAHAAASDYWRWYKRE